MNFSKKKKGHIHIFYITFFPTLEKTKKQFAGVFKSPNYENLWKKAKKVENVHKTIINKIMAIYGTL